MTIRDIQKHYTDRTMSVREVTDAYLARIEERDGTLGAFLETFAASARLRADELDASVRTSEPTALWDSVCKQGYHSCCGENGLWRFAHIGIVHSRVQRDGD